ncbi:MAG: HelD family protein [Acidimicrobiales bacterium]
MDDLAMEQAHVDRAWQRVDQLRAAASHTLSGVLSSGKGLTHQALEERDAMVRLSLARIAQLDLADDVVLCFGRIDERPGPPVGAEQARGGEPAPGSSDAGSSGAGSSDAGSPGAGSYHIGRLAVSGQDMEPLVVDWRAPVAEPFYRATGRHPMGLARRRHFAAQGRRLLGIEDELFGGDELLGGAGAPGSNDAQGGDLSGPGALLAALDRSRSGQMRDIVATIQAAQDEIIRAPLAGVLVVQGGPGTGKTAVALHRAAYLLYTYRFPLERQGVLVVGPNPVFMHYIARVVPSLGEAGVATSSIDGLATGAPRASGRAEEPGALSAVKGDARMARVLARAVRDRERPPRSDVAVAFGPYRLRLRRDELAAAVVAARRRRGTHNARRRIVDAAVGPVAFRSYEEARSRLGATGRERPSAEVVSDLLSTPELVGALERMWPRLSPYELLHDLYGSKPLLASAAAGILGAGEIELLFRPRAKVLSEVPWTPADLPLLDEARELLGPAPATGAGRDWPRRYGHIVVDEAQDLSAMQLRMLRRRSATGSMTVVGDMAQCIGAGVGCGGSGDPSGPPSQLSSHPPSHPEQSWGRVTAHLPRLRPPRTAELEINYRAPAEVMEVAAAVLASAGPGLRAPRSVRSSGHPVVFKRSAPDQLAGEAWAMASRELARFPQGTVGVVVPAVLEEAVRARGGGFRGEAGRGLGDGTAPFASARASVLRLRLAKGLEFDSVVVVAPDELIAEAGARGLYVALTRATKALSVLYSSELPAVLARFAAQQPA